MNRDVEQQLLTDALHRAEVHPMQLHLTIGEFEILKSLAEDEKRLCCDAVPSLQQVSDQMCLQDRWD